MPMVINLYFLLGMLCPRLQASLPSPPRHPSVHARAHCEPGHTASRWPRCREVRVSVGTISPQVPAREHQAEAQDTQVR